MAGEFTSGADVTSVTKGLIQGEEKNTQALTELSKTIKSHERTLKTSSTGGGGKPGGGGGTGGGGNGPMPPGTLANVPGAPKTDSFGMMAGASGMLAGALGAIGGGIQLAGAVAGAGYNLMPDVQQTINRETSFYNASVAGGGLMSRQQLRQTTFNAMKGGMTSVGSDAMVAEYLANRGMVTDSSRNSTYMQTIRGVSNAAKYLNMSNDRAVTAIEGLTSGTTSRGLLQNLGIYTSDLGTGKPKTQAQIMSEIGDRLTAGRGSFSAADVEESFRRGNLGASLAGLGLSEDQQLIMKQFLIEKAKGNTLDLQDDKAMAKLAADAGVNPNQSAMDIMGLQTGAMNKAAEPYIKGMQDAVPIMKGLTDASGALAEQFGELKAAIDTVAGSREGGAVIQALGQAMQGLTGIVNGLATAMLGMAAMNGLGGLGGKLGGGLGGKLGGKLGGGLGKLGSGLARAGLRMLPAVATVAALGEGQHSASEALAQGKDPWKEWRDSMDPSKAGGMAVLNWLGAPLSALGVVSAQNWHDQGTNTSTPEYKKYTEYQLLRNPMWRDTGMKSNDVPGGPARPGGYRGGPSSTINATGPSGRTSGKQGLTFIMPVNGKIVDKYGPRDSFMTASGNMSSSMHKGIDIAASEGTPIMASADGQVISAGPNGGWGNCTKIKHPNGYTTLYAHQSRFGTSTGANVRQGEVIGYVGTTGNSTGPHLHFEVWDENGNPMDPEKVISGSFAGTQAQGSNPNHKTAGGSAASKDISAIIDARGLTSFNSPPSSYGGAQNARKQPPSGSDRSGSGAVAGQSRGRGNTNLTSGKNNLTNNRMSISLPGLFAAKTGVDYVPQDGPMNLHAGEAVLTAEQADVWRSAIKGNLRGGGRNVVTINLTIGQASDSEAERFAKLVKRYLDEDSLIDKMGRK